MMDRRSFLQQSAAGVALTGMTATQESNSEERTRSKQPNILYVMTDQQRFDTIRALGNPHIYTPNFDRLVKRGITFQQGYSTCPVCVPSRYTIRTGCFQPTTALWQNMGAAPTPEQSPDMETRCGGPFLAKRMRSLGYRTFGIGKFHSQPWDADLGYDVQLHSEELYSPDSRKGDAYAAWIAKEHPYYDFLECLMGERTEMYYMPQMSATPAECGVEWWAADRAIECIEQAGDQPYFGFVSFVGPHPPVAPPIPFNRMYDPDRMPNPIRGDIATDHMDEQIPWMNYLIWAEAVNDPWARVVKARYYGELSYIDHCLGRILDAVDARSDADNTLICFFSDHGDHLGDHHAWQKESYFESSCHIPYLLSWPAKYKGDQQCDDLVCLADLYGIATSAAGTPELQEGTDVLAALEGRSEARKHLVGFHGRPGTDRCTIMVRRGDWKYIYIANGGREQLFNVTEDPNELTNLTDKQPAMRTTLRSIAATHCAQQPGAGQALDETGDLRDFPYTPWEKKRIHQFDRSRGVHDFPEKPEDLLKQWAPSRPGPPPSQAQ